MAQWPLTERRTGSQSPVRMADHPWSPAGSAATAETGTLSVNSDITKQGAMSGAAIASTKGTKLASATASDSLAQSMMSRASMVAM